MSRPSDASPTPRRWRRSSRVVGTGSGSASAACGRCCARWATRSSASAARSSPGPTARAPSSRSRASRSGARPATASGETPKPHLVTYRERIVVDGRPIDAATFAAPGRGGAAARRPDRAAPRPADRVRAADRGDVPPLRAAGLDLALVEVGLGGRLDATQRVGRRRGGADQRRAWTTPPAGADDRGDRPREGRRSSKRGDLAVTGADGEALAIMRRRCARLGVPLDRRAARRRSSAGTATRCGSSCRGSGRGRRPARAAPGGERRGRRRAARRARGGRARDGPRRTPGGAGTRPPAGPAAWSSSTSHAGGRGRCCSTARTTRTGRAPSPRRSTTSRRTSPGPAARRLDRSSGRRWPTRTSRRRRARSRRRPALDGATVVCTAVDVPRAMPAGRARGRVAGGAGAPAARSGSRSPDPDRPPLDARARRPATARSSSPGSLYLVGEARARLVDDPLLRDPVAA